MSKIHAKGDVVHAIKRGGRGMPIVKDSEDRYRFLKLLYFLNDSNHPTPWERDVNKISKQLHFQRPDSWAGGRTPYINILSYCLMDNHFHILARIEQEEGLAHFLGSVSSSMSQFFNKKYDTKGGSIFQRPTEIKVVEDKQYYDHLNFYINVKNPFERFEGGLANAVDNFDAAYDFAFDYPFSSLKNVAGKHDSPIVDDSFPSSLRSVSPGEYKDLAHEFITKQYPRLNTGDDTVFLE